MKNFKKFVKEENLKDFDEDCLAGKNQNDDKKVKEETNEEKNENI